MDLAMRRPASRLQEAARVWRQRLRRQLVERDWRLLPVSIGRVLLRPFPDHVYLRLGFRLFHGYWPDYRNPASYNEKIHAYMLRCRDPLLRIPADKIATRQYVAERVGADLLVPLLGVWDRPEDVPLATLPRPCVLKPTAASGMILILRQGDSRSDSELRDTMRYWLRKDFSKLHREWCYQGLPRRLLAEQLLGDESGPLPADYKVYVFGGDVRYIQVDRGRFGRHTRNIYDKHWQPLPARWSLENHAPDPRPHCLQRMIDVALELARPFEFLRVDYYVVADRLYLGELTNYPGAGFERFIPAEYSLVMGAYWPRPGERSDARRR